MDERGRKLATANTLDEIGKRFNDPAVAAKLAEPKLRLSVEFYHISSDVKGFQVPSGITCDQIVTAFDLDNRSKAEPDPDPRTWKPKIFHNWPGLIAPNEDLRLEAWKAGMYSTAAITYFPIMDGYLDGGLYANNPSMCALSQLFDERYAPNVKPLDQQIALLSIGSGGNLLAAHLARPPVRADATHVPAVVLAHGYPSDVQGADQAAAALPELADRISSEMGWLALAVALRGCAGSEGSFSLSGWLEDLQSAVAHLRETERVSGVWLVGFGHMPFSYRAARACAKEFRGIVTIGGPTRNFF